MTTLQKKGASHFQIFNLSNGKQIKYWIGLAPSATSKGPQVNTAEPMVSDGWVEGWMYPFFRR